MEAFYFFYSPFPLFTGVRGKGYSRKFTVANGSSTYRQAPGYGLCYTPSGSKGSDLVLFVAPFRIKGLRLVTAQLPKKLRPSDRGYGPGRYLTSQQPTRHV